MWRATFQQSLPPAIHFLSIFTAFGISPLSVFATSTDPDTYTYDQAMGSEYRDDFIAAALIEVEALEGHQTWTEIALSSINGPVIPSTWVFKIKRLPDGTIKKFKARLCLRGDLQKGKYESYAPVAAFPSLRILLIAALSCLIGKHVVLILSMHSFQQNHGQIIGCIYHEVFSRREKKRPV